MRVRIVLRWLLVVLSIPALAWMGLSLLTHPSNERNWKPEHAQLPAANFDGNLVRLEGIRDFRCISPDSCIPDYYDRTFDLDGLESVWFVLAVFHEEEQRGPAHSMLSFGFDDGTFVVISVEARKEVGESYSTLQGLCNKYEIIYVVGDERDLILTRAVYRPDDVYLYPIRTSREKARELFVGMLHKLNELRERPEFYNTLTNNCTSKLRDHVNAISPGRLPPSWKLLLPGYSDELLRDLDLLDADVSIEEARRRFWINDRARRAADSPDFSAQIRETD